MAKPEQVLVIDPPNELRFRGPFTSQVTSYMKLYNPIDKKVFFKIKTTAPKKYCVRPNCGVLEPSKGVEVAVSLQPFEYDPAEKNKHKFMVLSTIAPDGESNMDTIWSNLKPEDSMDSKLKCVFEMPVESEAAPGEEPATAEDARKRLPEAKPQPKRDAEPAPELVKDIKNLRMEESYLRQENMELKEELLRVKRSMTAQLAAAGSAGSAGQLVGRPEPASRQAMDLVIALVIALVGIVLGKFFL